MTKFTEMIRDLFEETEQKQLATFDESITNPDNVVVYEQIQYGAEKQWHTLDIYRPKDSVGECLPKRAIQILLLETCAERLCCG